MAVPAQIAVLLALTANLFDPVPLDQMKDAGHAVQEAAAKIPAEVSARFETAHKLSDEDRRAIIEIARQAVVAFLPKPEAKPDAPEQKTERKSGPKTKDGNRSESKTHKLVEETDPRPESKFQVGCFHGNQVRCCGPKPKAESESKPDVSTKSESGPEPEAKA